MNYRTTDSPTRQDKNDIFQELLKYNLQYLEDKEPKELGIFLEDDNNNKIAGLIGSTHGNWLQVEYLWVSQEIRHKNIGTELLQKAEKTAKERGCKYVFLNTFSFQAPEFYLKMGYKEKFILQNYPCMGKRYYYTKDL